jgi:glycosyltransferase involved in cell wall biosynthesis
MKISIVVPAFNEAKLLPASLRAIQASACQLHRRGWSTELIVCDNNSTDATAALARAGGARVVFEPFNQIGRARNRGAAAATGRWLVFIDADSQPSAELFDDFARAIISGRVLAGSATLRLDASLGWFDIFVHAWALWSRLTKSLAGTFIFCEAEAFHAVGGFSERLYIAEEFELTKKLKVLAQERSRRLAILSRHPLLVSARKMRLYRLRELLAFLLRFALRPRQTLTDRGACTIWYDGRR